VKDTAGEPVVIAELVEEVSAAEIVEEVVIGKDDVMEEQMVNENVEKEESAEKIVTTDEVENVEMIEELTAGVLKEVTTGVEPVHFTTDGSAGASTSFIQPVLTEEEEIANRSSKRQMVEEAVQG
jgi:hypothetical protein